MISLIKKKGINPKKGATLYFPQWTRVSTITKTALAEIMARGSTFSVGEVEGTMTDFAQHICDQLLAGNAVYIQGLGTYKLKVSGASKEKIEDVTSQGATVSVVFEPDEKLTLRLTIEREFQFVTKPTAEGQKDAEAEEIPDTDGGQDEEEGPSGKPIG